MKLTKTVKLRINVTLAQEDAFRQMMEQYRLACDFVSQYVFDHDFLLSIDALNKALYRKIRARFGLKSQLAQSSIRTVVAKYKTVEENMTPYRYHDETGYHSVPRTLEWLWKPIRFRRLQADLVRGHDYSFLDGGKTVSVNTLGKREKCACEREHFEEYLDGRWKIGTAKLVELKGLWYLHIPVTKEVAEFHKENAAHVVGIDRGLRFPAVSYDENGKTMFLSGKKIATKRRKFQKVRRQLQARGTKSAKRRLRRISGRENRWMSDVNHQISKTLVRRYGEDTLYVIEDLEGISFEKQRSADGNRELHSWSFYQLEQFMTYKAHETCSEVIKVPAAYTSQRCPKCGRIRKESRDHHRHLYTCPCGYRSNDDRVGAMNIQHLGEMWMRGEKPRYRK